MDFEIGIDEAGRGAWAGPIVACAIFKPRNTPLPTSIRDSKELSPKQRSLAYEYLIKNFHYGVGIVSPQEIDSEGLSWANRQCMRLALKSLKSKISIPPLTSILIDGVDINVALIGVKPPRYIVNGDRICPTISAASIIAKVCRDELMNDLSKSIPLYGFEKHKGYGTPFHSKAIKQHGVTTAHRNSYKPIKKFLS
jgi:ribonuclease HII